MSICEKQGDKIIKEFIPAYLYPSKSRGFINYKVTFDSETSKIRSHLHICVALKPIIIIDSYFLP